MSKLLHPSSEPSKRMWEFYKKWIQKNRNNLQANGLDLPRVNIMSEKTIQSNVQAYAIGTVAEITQVNPITLRAWEHRYRLVVPQRNPNGRRLYSQSDVDKIQAIVNWVNQGVPIGQVRKLLNTAEVNEKKQAKNTLSNRWTDYQRQMLCAIQQLDIHALDDIYNEAISLYPFPLVLKNLIEKILTILGEDWEIKKVGVAEEHFFSSYIRNKIGARLLHLTSRRPSASTLLLACLPGEIHDLGLLCFALYAMENGFHCILLGANLPLNELERAANRVKPDVSVLFGQLDETLYVGIKKLGRRLPCSLAIVERETNDKFSFSTKGIFKISKDFTTAMRMIQKMIALKKKTME